MIPFGQYIRDGLSRARHLDNYIGQGFHSKREKDGSNMKQKKAKIQVNGKERWISGNSVQQVVDNALHAKDNVAMGVPGFSNYAEEYVSLYKANGSIQRNTLVGYQCYLRNHLSPFFLDTPVSEISVNDVQAYINSKSKNYTAKTIREHLDFLSQIFDSAMEDGFMTKNPCLSKRLTIVGKRSVLVKAYDDDEYKELENLLDHLLGTERLCLALSLYTGMRQGEMFALIWENVDLERNLIHVTASVEWPSSNKGVLKCPKTENGIRDIPIIPQLKEILEEQWNSSGFVLTSQRQPEGEPMTRQAVKRLYERINNVGAVWGITTRYLSHRARHSVATILNNVGADDVSISTTLGHSDPSFTRRQYVTRQTKQVRKGMDAFSDYVSNL